MKLPSSVRGYSDAVAQAVSQLRLAGVNGPYALVLSAAAYTAASGGSDEGYPVFHHIERVVDGGIIWAPAIEGAFVLTTRGGDFELDIGQDISIGYLSHSPTVVELYFQEILHLPAADDRGFRRAGAGGEEVGIALSPFQGAGGGGSGGRGILAWPPTLPFPAGPLG